MIGPGSAGELQETLHSFGIDPAVVAAMVEASEALAVQAPDGARLPLLSIVAWAGDTPINAVIFGNRCWPLEIPNDGGEKFLAPSIEEQIHELETVRDQALQSAQAAASFAGMRHLYLAGIESICEAWSRDARMVARDFLLNLVRDLRASDECFARALPRSREAKIRAETPEALPIEREAYANGATIALGWAPDVSRWDRAFIRFLESRGKTEAAESWQAHARANWSRWADVDGIPPFVRFLELGFRGEIQAEINEKTRIAALSYPVMIELTEFHSKTWTRRGGQLELPGSGIVEIPTLEDATLTALLERGMDWLGSVSAHRLLRWEVTQGHLQFRRNGDRTLIVEGGWSGLAEQIGALSKSDPEKVRAIVLAQAHCRFTLPDGSRGNLLSYREPSEHASRGCRRVVELTLGTPLLPNFIFGLPKGEREARRLVPMTGLPPFWGRPNEHGRQASLALSVVAHLRAHAIELVRHGSAHVPFSDLARRHGLDAHVAAKVLDRWTRDGDDGSAFLKREGSRLSLGAAHQAALEFLLEAGKRELQGQEAGKRSVSRRAASRERVAKTLARRRAT